MSINNGKFNLIIGCMFSGKTSELINRCNRYAIGNRKCLVVKYANDDRYDSNKIVTHNNISVEVTDNIKTVATDLLYKVDKLTHGFDVVCIDEIQFYKDAHIFCDKWANNGKIVEACGLNGTFNREPFPIISKLLPLVESVTFLNAICKETGNDGHYSKIDNSLKDRDANELIGGADKYTAVDRQTFFTNNRQEAKHFRSFIDIYLQTVKFDLTADIVDEFVDYFDKMCKKGKYLVYADTLKKCFEHFDSKTHYVASLNSIDSNDSNTSPSE